MVLQLVIPDQMSHISSKMSGLPEMAVSKVLERWPLMNLKWGTISKCSRTMFWPITRASRI